MADAPETLDMEVLCMQMIVDAGSAKSDYMEALQAVKAGDYETAAAKMKSGDEQYAAGHAVEIRGAVGEACQLDRVGVARSVGPGGSAVGRVLEGCSRLDASGGQRCRRGVGRRDDRLH